MDKVKIQEIAEEAGLSSDNLIIKAKELGFDVKGANSKISFDDAGILVDYAISGTLPKGFKKPSTKSGITVAKKKTETSQAKVPYPTRGLGEILEEVEEAYEKDLKNLGDIENINLYDELKTFFDYVYAKRIHISCLELPILKILLTKVDWLSRNELLNELKNYGQFNRGYLSLDHLWSQRFSKGKEASLLNKIVEHDATKKGNKKSKYRIKNNVHSILNKIVEKYNIEDIKSLIEERLEYASKKTKVPIPMKHNIDSKIMNLKKIFSTESQNITYKFSYKNILLKGVPGTGKSRTLENIINNQLNLKDHYDTNVLRINVHSASSNADLMQGIGISSNDDGHIEYKEKQGLILELIERATFNPNQPFVLVLEEIQENSLNELIGDLIYLIEDSKRAIGYKADDKEYNYSELLDEIMTQNSDISSIKLPSLISKSEKTKRMIIPHNLYIFCTSNYRDDRKVIEDNLLRRFEVIEIYPLYQNEEKDRYQNNDVAKFLNELNTSIMKRCQESGEIHPDRFMIGHSIWLDVTNKQEFYRAFLKVITEFKDIKDTHFDEFKKITQKLTYPFDIEANYESYEE